MRQNVALPTRRRRRSSITLVVVGALVVAGCGGGDDDDAAAGGQDTSEGTSRLARAEGAEEGGPVTDSDAQPPA